MLLRLGIHNKIARMILLLTLVLGLTQSWYISPTAKAQVANYVVVSEIYGGGGNSGATFKNDFVELYNPTLQSVSLAGWSVQYASAAGTTWSVTKLSGNIPAHGYYLVQLAAGSGGTASLPQADATGTTNLSATAGKVALVNKTTAISGKSDPGVIDFVGYGSTASAFEGTAPAKAPSNTTSVERKNNEGMDPNGAGAGKGNGWDTNDNASDFVVSPPNPQNSSSPAEPVSGTPAPAPTPAPTASCVKGSNGISHMIYEIQGTGDVSPVVNQNVVTCGTVYAIEQNGYWMQNPNPDQDPRTSEGIYVYRGTSGTAGVHPGDIVTQAGQVTEYYGLTELSATGSNPNVLGTGPLPAPFEITPQSVPDLASLEHLEGMRVLVPSATVVAGSNQYGETFAVAGTNVTSRVSRKDTTTPLFKFKDAFGNKIDNASTFDQITGNPTGPLSYTYDSYAVLWQDGAATVKDTGNTQNSLAAGTAAQLTTASFNVENYFNAGSLVSPNDPNSVVTQQQFDTKTAKLSFAIRQSLGSPDVVALQEVENLTALNSLIAKIKADGGPAYSGYLIEGNDSRGINVAYIVKQGLSVLGAEQSGKTATTGLSGCGPSGTDLLFSRPPLTLHVQRANGEQVSLINNHFKSRGGTDPLNNEFRGCRNEQASYVANLANQEAARAGSPSVIVLGDLNSFEDEEDLGILQTQAGLTNLVSNIPAGRDFSYIYKGKAQFLDHILVRGALSTKHSSTDSAKIDPDFPMIHLNDATTPLHVSDHDPIRSTFN